MSRADLALEALRRVERHGDENDWLGPDPYEGLNARASPDRCSVRQWAAAYSSRS